MAEVMRDDGAGERPLKRARVDADGDAMTVTRELLMRTADPHLQAKLLLDYSAQAVAPEAATEAAIDFLFAFLQQSQSAANGDLTKSPTGTESSTMSGGGTNGAGGGSNAVVVAAIVRGLRGLLAVKPQVVEPMIQLDAMGEQLTQCVSVPEDFKLRSDMLRIVLDCLLAARKFVEAAQLLRACVVDHDDGLRAVCLEGYLRVMDAGHRLQPSTETELVDRLGSMILFGDDARTRVLTARLLGVVAESSFEPSARPPIGVTSGLQDTIVNTLACAVRDPSWLVRCEVAKAFRRLHAAPNPESLYAHLLQKKQINEDLSEIDSQSVAMLSSGAMLTLLEDDRMEVVTETSISMRTLCEAAKWTSDQIDRAASTHIELVGRVGIDETSLVVVLGHLEVFLSRLEAMGQTPYPLSREELCYFLGSLPTSSLSVASAALAILPFCSIDSSHAAARTIKYVVDISQSKRVSSNDAASGAFAQPLSVSIHRIADMWAEKGISPPPESIEGLRRVALSAVGNPMASCCQILHDTLCSPMARLGDRSTQRPIVPAPRFLVG